LLPAILIQVRISGSNIMVENFGWCPAGATVLDIACFREPDMSSHHAEIEQITRELTKHGQLNETLFSRLGFLYRSIAIYGKDAGPLGWPCDKFDVADDMFSLIELYKKTSLVVLTVASLLGYTDKRELLEFGGQADWIALGQVAKIRWGGPPPVAPAGTPGIRNRTHQRAVFANEQRSLTPQPTWKEVTTRWNAKNPNDLAEVAQVMDAHRRAFRKTGKGPK
jgi:hypothetical protein